MLLARIRNETVWHNVCPHSFVLSLSVWIICGKRKHRWKDNYYSERLYYSTWINLSWSLMPLRFTVLLLCLRSQVNPPVIALSGCPARFCTPLCRSGSSRSFTTGLRAQGSLSTARGSLMPSLWVSLDGNIIRKWHSAFHDCGYSKPKIYYHQQTEINVLLFYVSF